MQDGKLLSSNGWYWVSEEVNSPFQQGDLLLGIPIYTYNPQGDEALEPEVVEDAEIKVLGTKRNLIVLSQSCDINGQKKGEISLLLAPIYAIEEMPQSFRSPVMLEMIRQDKMASYFMLDSCDIDGYCFSIQIVDFRAVVSIPLNVAYLYKKGGLKIIHMNSPYPEALGAAYGRSIMRVGLPSAIAAFEINDKKRKDFMRDFSLLAKEKRREAIQDLEDLTSQLKSDIEEF